MAQKGAHLPGDRSGKQHARMVHFQHDVVAHRRQPGLRHAHHTVIRPGQIRRHQPAEPDGNAAGDNADVVAPPPGFCPGKPFRNASAQRRPPSRQVREPLRGETVAERHAGKDNTPGV